MLPTHFVTRPVRSAVSYAVGHKLLDYLFSHSIVHARSLSPFRQLYRMLPVCVTTAGCIKYRKYSAHCLLCCSRFPMNTPDTPLPQTPATMAPTPIIDFACYSFLIDGAASYPGRENKCFPVHICVYCTLVTPTHLHSLPLAVKHPSQLTLGQLYIAF